MQKIFFPLQNNSISSMLKMIQHFAKSIDSDMKSYKISSAITSLAKSLDAKVIAEFVHNQEVLDKILELGIDYSQGYFSGPQNDKLKG